MKTTIPIFWPSYDGKALQAEFKKLFPADMSNRWLGQAHKVDEFEAAFAKKFGYPYCISVSSATAALELAYHLIGLEKGDEVISAVLTCTATNVPLVRNGVKIVFADIKEDMTIDPDDVAKKITPKTKAIIAVTLGGVPIDKKLFSLARKHKIPVVVDTAQSLGVPHEQGDFICHSFQAIKHFTTGDGGMLVVRTKALYQRAKKLRWYGIDRELKAKSNWQPYVRRQMTMEIDEPGYKFHMNDIAASMGLAGLKDSDRYLAHRKKIARYYDAHLKCPTVSGGSYWLYAVLLPRRDEIADKLRAAGIETNMVHLRNDIFRVFGGKRLPLPTMNRIEPLYTYIPIHTAMTMADAKYIVTTLNELL